MDITTQTWSIWLDAADKLSIHFWTNSSSFSKAPLPTTSKYYIIEHNPMGQLFLNRPILMSNEIDKERLICANLWGRETSYMWLCIANENKT